MCLYVCRERKKNESTKTHTQGESNRPTVYPRVGQAAANPNVGGGNLSDGLFGCEWQRWSTRTCNRYWRPRGGIISKKGNAGEVDEKECLIDHVDYARNTVTNCGCKSFCAHKFSQEFSGYVTGRECIRYVGVSLEFTHFLIFRPMLIVLKMFVPILLKRF